MSALSLNSYCIVLSGFLMAHQYN